MNLKQQSIKLPIINYNIIVDKDKQEKQHGNLHPNSTRAVFCGPPNYSKTNLLAPIQMLYDLKT